MSERKKPSQLAPLRVVEENEAGTVEEFISSTYLDERSARYSSQVFTGSDILDKVEPRRFLVPGWLVEDGSSVLLAKPGGGKSFFATSLAMEFLRGGTFAGHRLPKKRVLYVAAERASDIRDRLEAWLQYHEAPTELLEGFALWEMTEPLDATTPDAARWVVEQADRHKADVVFLDTWAQLTASGQENDNNATQRVIRDFVRPVLEATRGGHVMLIHHLGKNVENGGRGASSLQGAIDTEITLKFSDGARWADVTKINAGETPPPEYFRIESVEVPGRAMPSGKYVEARSVGVMVSGKPNAKPWEEEIRRVLTNFEPEGGASRRQIQKALGHSDEELERSADTWSNRLGKELLAQGKVEKIGDKKATRYRLGPTWKLAELADDEPQEEPLLDF
jgi:hypothetical protein